MQTKFPERGRTTRDNGRSMTPRSIRRAAERKQLKEARKQAPSATPLPTVALPIASSMEPCDAQSINRSTGPKTPEGKANSALNNLRHGLAGQFRIIASESEEDFNHLLVLLRDEHEPSTATEEILVTRMAEHVWLSRRALMLQNNAIETEDQKSLALYLRYQTTNDRAFSKCLADLLKLRKHRYQFESQDVQIAAKEASTRLKNAQAAHQEFKTEIESTIEAPMPGYSSIPYADVRDLFKGALTQVVRNMQTAAA